MSDLIERIKTNAAARLEQLDKEITELREAASTLELKEIEREKVVAVISILNNGPSEKKKERTPGKSVGATPLKQRIETLLRRSNSSEYTVRDIYKELNEDYNANSINRVLRDMETEGLVSRREENVPGIGRPKGFWKIKETA